MRPLNHRHSLRRNKVSGLRFNRLQTTSTLGLRGLHSPCICARPDGVYRVQRGDAVLRACLQVKSRSVDTLDAQV